MFQTLRIIFAGTTNFSAYYLNALIHSQHKIIAIFSQNYTPPNYEQLIYVNNINEIAKQYQLPIFHPKSLDCEHIIHIIQDLNPDIMIVIAYGLIIPKQILNIPKFGCINVHASLLPRWRGAAPIQRALEAGDKETGISIIQMNSGIDTGDILDKKTYKISHNDTSLDLFNKLASIGSTALLQTLTNIIYKRFHAIPQNNTYATYAHKITKHESCINWNISSIQLERRIRAFNPWPGNYFKIKKNIIKIWQAQIKITNNTQDIIPGTIILIDKQGIHVATKDGSLILTLIQIEGKKRMEAHNLLNSKKHWFTPGIILK